MKKVIIIVAIIIVIALIGGGAFLLFKQNKKSIEPEQFKTIAEAKEYNVEDVKEQFTGYEYMENAQIAVSKDSSYLIEYYKLSNDEYAKSFYNDNKTPLQGIKKDDDFCEEKSEENYETYILKTEERYIYISRINNTIVYTNVSQDAQEEVKALINELGY